MFQIDIDIGPGTFAMLHVVAFKHSICWETVQNFQSFLFDFSIIYFVMLSKWHQSQQVTMPCGLWANCLVMMQAGVFLH